MTDLALYPGCLISARLPFLERSSRLVLEKLGFNLESLNDFTCCFDPIILKPLDFESWLVMAARNIALAERKGVDLLTLCNGCFCSLNEANHVLKRDEKKKLKVNEHLSEVGMEFKGTINVLHPVHLIRNLGEERVSEVVQRPVSGFKVGAHHGCHLIRPKRIAQIDDKRKPTILNEVVSWIGAESVQYAEDLMCCGGGVMGVDRRTGQMMLSLVLDLMHLHGVTHIVTPCPYCFIQFDHGQRDRSLPVLYLLELYGLALGLSAEEMGLKYHRIKSEAWES